MGRMGEANARQGSEATVTMGEKSGRERVSELAAALDGDVSSLDCIAITRAIASDLDTLTAAREEAEEILTMMARGEWSRVRVEKLCLLLIDGGTHADRG